MSAARAMETFFEVASASSTPQEALRELASMDKHIIQGSDTLSLVLANARPELTAVNLSILSTLADRIIDPATFLTVCEVVFECASAPQLALVWAQVASLCRHVVKTCTEIGKPEYAVGLLRLCLNHNATKHSLTPVHTEFVKLALQCKAYALAVSVIDRPIFDVDKASEYGLTTTDVLSYFFYAGMLYAGLKRWKDAVLMWKMCLVVPATVPSAIMVEAHRKLCIASLLASGKPAALPDTVGTNISKVLATFNSLYKQAAVAYEAELSAPGPLGVFIDNNKAELQSHNNYHMIRLLVEDAARRRIVKLTRTYVAVTLADVATAAGLPSAADAERVVSQMIVDGLLCASIDQDRAVLRFADSQSSSNEASLGAKLEHDVEAIMQLVRKIKEADEAVMLTKQYLSKRPTDGSRSGDMSAARHYGSGDLAFDSGAMYGEPSVGDIADLH